MVENTLITQSIIENCSIEFTKLLTKIKNYVQLSTVHYGGVHTVKNPETARLLMEWDEFFRVTDPDWFRVNGIIVTKPGLVSVDELLLKHSTDKHRSMSPAELLLKYSTDKPNAFRGAVVWSVNIDALSIQKLLAN